MASSDCSEPEIERLINGLASDAKRLRIQANESNAKVYRVQKTFLAGASATLAEHCCSQQPTRLGLSEKALRIFLAWLISGDLDEVANCQMSLAQAWDFGEQYGIPQFQDDVMRQLVPCLGDEEVDQSAVVEALLGTCVAEAYVHGAGPPSPSTTWEELPDFYLDLIDAMREVDSNASLVVGDFLFSDQDGKKRSTVLRRYMGCDGTNDSSVGVTDP